MFLSVEQLVCRSFPNAENTVFASENLPQAVQQSFIHLIVHPYWQNQSLLGKTLRAAYLQQLLPNQTLFGWLYYDASASDQESWTVDFICYYTAQKLDGTLLDGIFNCLERGPATQINWPENDKLKSLTLPTSGDYKLTEPGIDIPSSIRARTRLMLYQEKLLHFFVSVEIPQEVQPETAETQLSPQRQPVADLPLTRPELEPLSIGFSLEPLENLSEPFAPPEKVALLIGVSQCGLSFKALPCVENDLESLKAVLENPAIGAFSTVETLLNPDSQQMAEAIEQFLSSCPSNSLALLYFSGHGVWDSQGTLCLSTRSSKRTFAQKKIARSTFISADFLSAVLKDSTAQNPIVILDCCLAEDGLVVESERRKRLEQFKQQFAETNAVVLASSTTIHPAGVLKGYRSSIYTAYLVEGLATGIADMDENGAVLIEEWYRYAKDKTQLTSPAIRPLLCGLLEQQRVEIAQSSTKAPKLQYRREVERSVKNGRISLVNQLILDKTQKSLALASADCIKIRAEVLKPHQEYQHKLRQYATAFLEHAQRSGSVRGRGDSRTFSLQDALGLTDADVAPIQSEIFQQLAAVQTQSSKELASSGGAIAVGGSEKAPSYLRSRFALQAMQQGAVLQASLTNALAIAEREVSRWIHSLQRAVPNQAGALRPSRGQGSPQLPSFITPVTVLLGLSGLLLLLTVGIFNARQQQNRKRTLTELNSLLQQRDYEKCVNDAQSLIQSGSADSVQLLLEQCRAGLAWKNPTVASLQPIGCVQALAFGAGNVLVSGGTADIQLWNTSTKTLLKTLKGHNDRVWSLGTNANGTMLASGSGDKSVKLWQLPAGKLLRTLSGHQGTVWSVTFIPKHQMLASASEDGTVRLWNTSTGQLVRSLQIDKRAFRAVAVSPDGQFLISGGVGNAITLWDVDNGRVLRTIKGHSDRIIALAANNSQIASGSVDRTVKVWNLSNGSLLRTFKAQDSPGRALEFNPSTQILASASGSALRLQDPDTGKLLNQFSGSPTEVSGAAFSPDGKTMAVARQDKLLNILQR